MNEFKLLAKRDGWIIINHFLEIKSNPKRLLIYLVYLLWIGSIVFNVILRSRNPLAIPQLGSQILGAGFVGFGTAIILFLLYRGTKESSTFFTDALKPVYIANGVIAYLIFIFAAAKAGQHELTKPYIYLIPGSNLLKIISSNLTDIVRMSVNILALNIPLWILLDTPLHVMVIMIIFTVSFHCLNLSSGFLTRVIFPNALDQKTLYPIFLMLQFVLLLLPGVIVGGGMAFIYKDLLLAFVGILVANIILIGALLLLSNAVFARMEWK